MYDYTKERPKVFTEEGVQNLLDIRDNLRRLSKVSGAVVLEKAMTSGDSWTQLACVDFLEGRGDIRRVGAASGAGQDRIYTWTGRKD